MARTKSRNLLLLATSVALVATLATGSDARAEKRRKLTIDEAFEVSQLTGAPMFVVAGTAE